MIICIIKAIVGYFLLMFAGTNLLGFIIPSIENPMNDEKEVAPITKIISLVFSLITIVGFYALYYYWNIGVLIAAAMLMFARIPDHLVELKTGEKTTHKNMTKGPIDIFCTIIYWAALPVLWYSLCYLN